MDLIPLSDDELLYRSFYEELGEGGMKPRMPGDAGLKSALAKAVRLSSLEMPPCHQALSIARHPRFRPPYIHRLGRPSILYASAGEASITIEGESIMMEAGDMLMVSAGTYRSIAAFRDDAILLELSASAADTEKLPGLLPSLFSGKRYGLLNGRDSRIREIFHRLQDEAARSDSSSEMAMLMLSELSIEAGRSAGLTASRDIAEERSEAYRYLSLIESGFRTITLSSLADSLSITEQYASGLIRQKLGESFVNIVKTMKMRESLHLLMDTYRTCREIAQEVGYSSQEHFSRTFTDYFGISPMKLRDIRRRHASPLARQ